MGTAKKARARTQTPTRMVSRSGRRATASDATAATPSRRTAPTTAAGTGPKAAQAAASGTGASWIQPPLVAMLMPSTGNRAQRLYALTVTYEYWAAVLNTRRSSDESRKGAVVENDTTDRPNGAAIATAVTSPARPVVRIRTGPAARRSQPKPVGRGASSSPQPPAGHSARRIVTTATIGTRIASCGLISAATTARIADRSLRPRHSSRMASSRNTVPKLSTWPQITESNQVIGLKMTTAPAMVARRSVTPSSRTIEYTM